MEWIFLVALGIHIVSGFLCSRIALDMNRRPESWFFTGTMLGVMGIVLLMATSFRKSIPEVR